MHLTIERASAAVVDLAITLLANNPKPSIQTYKTDRDYSTTADFAVEDAARTLLSDLTPSIGFLGEERGHTGSKTSYWCFDPIDGTVNFARGIPNYGVSLAFINGRSTIHAEIALPAYRERYVLRDGNSYSNGEPLHVSDTCHLRDAVVSVGDFATGPGSSVKNAQRLATLSRLADQVGRVRMLGSAATDLAWLAAGRLDAVLMDSNHIWDVAAGLALAEGAGAKITTFAGETYDLSAANFIAAAPRIQSPLVATLA